MKPGQDAPNSDIIHSESEVDDIYTNDALQDSSSKAFDYHDTVYGSYATNLAKFARSIPTTKQASDNLSQPSIFLRKNSTFAAIKGYTGESLTGYCGFKQGKVVLLLVIMGFITGAIEFLIQWTLPPVHAFRLWVINNDQKFGAVGGGILTFLLYFAFAFTAVFTIKKLSPIAAGSGIPELKVILTGVELENFFSYKTMFAKIVGIITCIGGGYFVGREGPLVHVASIIGEKFLRLPFFRAIHKTKSLRMQVLSAASAVGVSTSYSTPIGGVFFSIEVTSTYFLISNYWKLFIATTCGTIMARLMKVYADGTFTSFFSSMFPTSFTPSHCFSAYELPIFALIGVVNGILGSSFVRLTEFIIGFLRKHLNKPGWWVIQVAVVALLFTVMVNLPGKFNQLTIIQSVNQIFSADDQLSSDWTEPYGIWYSLLTSGIIHFFYTAICVTMPVPAGIVIPAFATGGPLGRFLGEVIKHVTGANIHPGTYAIVSAASFCTGITRAFSAGIIAVEMTGQFHLIIPVLTATLISTFVADRFSLSNFNSTLKLKQLPFLPLHETEELFDKTAGEVMSTELLFLPAKPTYYELVSLLRKETCTTIPVVDTKQSRILLGTVSRRVAIALCNAVRQKYNLPSINFNIIEDDDSSSSEMLSHIKYTPKTPKYELANYDEENQEGNEMVSINKSISSESYGGTDAPVRSPHMKKKTISPLFSTFQTPNEPIDKSLKISTPTLLKKAEVNEDTIMSMRLNLIKYEVICTTSFTLVDTAPLEDIFILFSMLRCQRLFITSKGHLKGEITQDSLYKYISTQSSR